LESPGETSVGGQDFPLGKGRIWHRKKGSKSCISWVEKGLGSIESSEASLHLEVVVHLDLNIKTILNFDVKLLPRVQFFPKS
jgi:hypothetical protein